MDCKGEMDEGLICGDQDSAVIVVVVEREKIIHNSADLLCFKKPFGAK